MNEKMYDFEQNKRNNLIFYGIPSDPAETSESLAISIQKLIKDKMLLKREMIITQVNSNQIMFRFSQILIMSFIRQAGMTWVRQFLEDDLSLSHLKTSSRHKIENY